MWGEKWEAGGFGPTMAWPFTSPMTSLVQCWVPFRSTEVVGALQGVAGEKGDSLVM